MLKKILCRHRLFLRSFWITEFICMCISVILIACGYVYSVVEHNAFGREVTAFAITSKDYITVFGREIYLPVITIGETVLEFVKQYSSGIIKLLGFAVTSTEELIYRIVNLFC